MYKFKKFLNCKGGKGFLYVWENGFSRTLRGTVEEKKKKRKKKEGREQGSGKVGFDLTQNLFTLVKNRLIFEGGGN